MVSLDLNDARGLWKIRISELCHTLVAVLYIYLLTSAIPNIGKGFRMQISQEIYYRILCYAYVNVPDNWI